MKDTQIYRLVKATKENLPSEPNEIFVLIDGNVQATMIPKSILIFSERYPESLYQIMEEIQTPEKRKTGWEVLQSILNTDGGFVDTDLSGKEAIEKAMHEYASQSLPESEKNKYREEGWDAGVQWICSGDESADPDKEQFLSSFLPKKQ